MRAVAAFIVLVCLLSLAPHSAASQSATPTPTPVVPVPVSPEGGCPLPLTAGKCQVGPCDRSAIQPPSSLPGPRYARTPQGIRIRLQPLPGAASLSGLAVSAGRAAWVVPEVLGHRRTIRPRLYLARLGSFHPTVVSSPSCSTGIKGPFLSSHWLVWVEWHQTPFDLHDIFTIRAMNLDSRQTVSWSFPYRSDVLPSGVSLSGNTLIWTRQDWEGQGNGRTLVYGVYMRTLPGGPARTIQVVHENIGRFIPPTYVDGYLDPQIAGDLVVWQRSRWQDQMPRTDIMAATLPNGPVRVLAWNGAEAPVTNGWKVAWLHVLGDSVDLVQLDTRTGVRKVVHHNFLYWSPPQLSGTALSWQSQSHDRVSRYLLARDLLTGRRYTLVHWLASGATPTPLRAIGPGRADGNQVVWEQIARSGAHQTAYLAITSLPQQGPATTRDAATSPGLTVQARAHGVRLTMSLPKRVFAADEIVRATVRVDNLSQRTLVIDRQCDMLNPEVDVRAATGFQLYPPPVDYLSAPTSCASHTITLNPGAHLVTYPYVIVRAKHLQAAVTLAPARDRTTGPGPGSSFVVRTRVVTVGLVRADKPAVQLCSFADLCANVEPPVGVRVHGPLLYAFAALCGSERIPHYVQSVWLQPAPVDPAFKPPRYRVYSGCARPVTWNFVVGWVGTPVAHIHFSRGPR